MNIWTEGDSYMDGAYGVRLADLIRDGTGIEVTDGAAGGATFAEITDRIVASAPPLLI